MPKTKKTSKPGRSTSARFSSRKPHIAKQVEVPLPGKIGGKSSPKKKKEKVVPKKAPVRGEARQRRPAKKEIAKKKEIKPVAEPALKPSRYFEAIGRRKTAVARVRLWTQGEKVFLVNGKPYREYFPTLELRQIAVGSFEKMKCFDKFKTLVKARGGGFHAQAEAVRHGIARALVKFNPDFKKRLKKAGFLTRDSRMKERRKFGLKKARRAPQWSKR